MTTSPSRRFGAALVFSSLSLLAPAAAVRAESKAASAEAAPAPAPAPKATAAGKAEGAAPGAEDAGTAAEKPRHGARKKAPDGTTVIYDKVSGTWRAPTLGEGYWIGDRFWRYDSGLWLSAAAAAGPWQLVSSDTVPEAARRYPLPKNPGTVKLPGGIEAVFEPRLKVFKVAGHKGVFLSDGTFYRVDNGLWLGAASVDGPWGPVSPKPLPVPLRKAVGDPVEGQQATLPGGEVVVWDPAAKVFVLKDKPSVVLHDGRFYEKRDDKWFESTQPSSGFAEKNVSEVPLAVRFKFRKEPGAGGGAKAGNNAKAGRNGKNAAKNTKNARNANNAKNAKNAAKNPAKNAKSGGQAGMNAKPAGAGPADDAE